MTVREFAEAVGDAVFRRMGRATSRFQEETPLPVDVLESDDEYLAVFDAPGATASDVQVNYAGGAVEVRIDRFREFRDGFEMTFPGRGLSLDGRVTLPGDAVVDAEAARAELRDDGTLYVFLPKAGDAVRVEVTEDGGETRDRGSAGEAGNHESAGEDGNHGSAGEDGSRGGRGE
ncbi:Hsp20/alpha crystallin family protein [Halobacterium yunchengense]|uniref:Hsp20/alpha crystallin family protein n=1 Tax=Halobacterium yunchengense TaxID=3108497 RepID=UPI003009E8F3